MPRAGTYRNLLSVQHLVDTDASPQLTAEGEPIQAWVELAQCWGSVQPQGGRELFNAAAEERAVTVLIRMRYVPWLDGAMRIVCENLIYNIKNIVDVDNRHIEHLLACDEGVNLG